jgi:hypothetical protein
MKDENGTGNNLSCTDRINRNAYERPQLVVHGRIVELTRGLSGNPSDGMNGGPFGALN